MEFNYYVDQIDRLLKLEKIINGKKSKKTYSVIFDTYFNDESATIRTNRMTIPESFLKKIQKMYKKEQEKGNY